MIEITHKDTGAVLANIKADDLTDGDLREYD